MRQKLFTLIMLLATAIGMNAQDNKNRKEMNATTNHTKVLVAFFSRADENYAVGNIKKGNTHIVAEMIAAETGADLFHIAIRQNTNAVSRWPKRRNRQTHAQPSKEILTLKTMISFSWVIPTGGVKCRWPSIPLLRSTTGKAKPSSPSVHTKVVACRVPNKK